MTSREQLASHISALIAAIGEGATNATITEAIIQEIYNAQLAAGTPSNDEALIKEISQIVYQEASISHYGEEEVEVDNSDYVAREIVRHIRHHSPAGSEGCPGPDKCTASHRETGDALSAMLKENDRLRASVEGMRKGIQDFLDGNYDNPRKYRGNASASGQCPHARYYYEDCAHCDEAHLKAVLSPDPSTEGKQP